jgi:hypothetical protein
MIGPSLFLGVEISNIQGNCFTLTIGIRAHDVVVYLKDSHGTIIYPLVSKGQPVSDFRWEFLERLAIQDRFLRRGKVTDDNGRNENGYG